MAASCIWALDIYLADASATVSESGKLCCLVTNCTKHGQYRYTSVENRRRQQAGVLSSQDEVTSTKRQSNHYLCFGHDVCRQLHNGKVAFPDGPFDLVVSDLDGRRTAGRRRDLRLFAATIHRNLTIWSNLQAARCHIPRCERPSNVGKKGGGVFDVNRRRHAHFRNPTTSCSHKILTQAVSK